MTIYILGMGAVGSLFASVLYSNGQKVVGLCRGKHFDAIQSHGLTYVDIQGKEKAIPIGENFEVYTDLRSPSCDFTEIDSNDWIFISSKVYGLESLVKEYSDIIKKHGSLVLVQNGLGNEELVFEKLPDLRIYRILTTNGALLESPGRVRHTGPGYTKIGFPQSNPLPMEESKVKSLINRFRKSPLSLELDTHIDVLLWEKIFVNIGINAIASIYNIPNGGLIETQERKELMRDAITEAWKVAKAMKISVGETPDQYIDFTYLVCEKTKPNRNSMLQDLDQGRKTEIDFINGKIVEYGEKLGITTPINQELTRKIKNLEK
ncbi:MAG: 2-dehydropantoate 2-reductase [Promethearchaeota archaeon]|nr:MAG: 2-dehydropantoate 2-reductase [Candidatus Lokiarchaeota archaeon]